MSQPISPLQVEEYRALRATIRQRGTARVALGLISVMTWAALELAGFIAGVPPIASVLGVIMLAAGFEAVFALHVGVERVGRYIQVYYERNTEEPPAWEHIAMDHGSAQPTRWNWSRIDPLFTIIFLFALTVNFVPVALAGVPVEMLVYGIAHLAVAIRIVMAHRFAQGQRAADLAMMRGARRARNQESRSTDPSAWCQESNRVPNLTPLSASITHRFRSGCHFLPENQGKRRIAAWWPSHPMWARRLQECSLAKRLRTTMSLVRLLGFTNLNCGCVSGRYREVGTNREVVYVEEKGVACGHAEHQRNQPLSPDRVAHGFRAVAVRAS